MFINPQEEVHVSDENGNTITVKAKMDYNDHAKLEAALMRLKVKNAAGRNGRQAVRPDAADDVEIDATVTVSAQQVMLLQVNIKRWEGPDFTDANGRPIPCNDKYISLLDPNEPLVIKVLETIDANNAAPLQPPPTGEPGNPNHPTPSIFEG